MLGVLRLLCGGFMVWADGNLQVVAMKKAQQRQSGWPTWDFFCLSMRWKEPQRCP